MKLRPFLMQLLMPFVIVVFVSSCSVSFQSNQFNALTNMFISEEDPLEEARWLASWNSFDFDVYAANIEGGVVFVNHDGAYIHFNGWNITEAREILPYDQSVRIEFQGEELLYFVNERLVDRHVCKGWAATQLEEGVTGYLQECEGREPYSNEIDVNAAGQLVRLHFLLHPQYPALTMSPANIGQ